MPDEALGKDGACCILPATLKVGNGTEEGLVEAVNDLKRVLLAEEHLPGGVSVSRITGITIAATGILAVVNEYDAVIRKDCRRTALREHTVEEAFAGLCQVEQVPSLLHTSL